MPRRPAATRRRPPALTRDRIVDAALAVGDAEGLEAVSMNRLGQELGTTAMALYRHVDSKQALLAAMAERILAELDLESATRPGSPGGWRAAVAGVVHAWADLMAAHPRTVRLLYSERPVTRQDLLPARVMVEAMLADGFAPELAARAYRTVVLFVDSVLLAAPLDPDAGHAGWQRLPPDFLAEMPAVATTAPYVDALTYREVFDFGLRLLLDGIAAEAAGQST